MMYYERWNGKGNIFNIVDNMDGKHDSFFSDTEAKRRFAKETKVDGIMEIKKVDDGAVEDYKVIYHSAHGISGTILLCGNGSRCTAAYACTHGIVPKEKRSRFYFMTGDGSHSASFEEDPDVNQPLITISINDIKEVVKVEDDKYFANCGTAHFVKFVNKGELSTLNFMDEGRALSKEYQYLAPEFSILVNFVEVGDDCMQCRCYNSAIDAEILACGSASACIAVIHASCKGEHDGKGTKRVGWKMGEIIAGYTKDGDKYKEMYLQSNVFCEEKSYYKYGQD